MSMINVTTGNNLSRTSVIVDSSNTLRSVLEQNNIDYTRGMMHLDGASLQPGDLDKTFDDFGITERCYLLNVVKVDNAATIEVLGNALVITSGISLDNIKLVEKYRPQALVLFEGEDNEKQAVFKVSTGSSGSISKYGIVFNSATRDNDKLAVVTITDENIPEEGIQQYLIDKIGTSILSLNKVEAGLNEVVEEILMEQEEILDNITIG